MWPLCGDPSVSDEADVSPSLLLGLPRSIFPLGVYFAAHFGDLSSLILSTCSLHFLLLNGFL
ncbi:hypothetical protein PGB90_003753 [Kerria lacca]